MIPQRYEMEVDQNYDVQLIPSDKGEVVKASDCVFVKPLEWERQDPALNHDGPEVEAWECEFVDEVRGYVIWTPQVASPKWRLEIMGFGKRMRDDVSLPCDSLDHGKQLAQSHWEGPNGVGRYLGRASE